MTARPAALGSQPLKHKAAAKPAVNDHSHRLAGCASCPEKSDHFLAESCDKIISDILKCLHFKKLFQHTTSPPVPVYSDELHMLV